MSDDLHAGPYRLIEEIGAGATARVFVGVLEGEGGFARLVAVKTLHDHLARSDDFVAMLVDEAHATQRVRHVNVVSTRDVVAEQGLLHLIQDYIPGLSLSALSAKAREHGQRVPVSVAVALVTDVLHGLQAAHAATSEDAAPLDLVHRDLSPRNVLLGLDGVARIIDFGIAKARKRLQQTATGVVKGTIGYVAPEVLDGEAATPQADVYSAGVLLWELLASRRLYAGDDATALLAQIRLGLVEPPSVHAPDVPAELDAAVLRAVAPVPERFASAREMLDALERAAPRAASWEVGDWVRSVAGPELEERARRIDRLAHDQAPAATPVAAAEPPSEAQGRPSRRRLPAAAAVLVACLACLSVALRFGRTPHSAMALPVTSAAAASPPAPSAPSLVGAALGVDTATSPSPAAATVSPSVAPPAMRAPSVRSAPIVRAQPSSTRGPTSSPDDDCAIPFLVGPDRRRTYKPQCVHRSP